MKKPVLLSSLILIALILSAFALFKEKLEVKVEEQTKIISEPPNKSSRMKAAPEFVYDVGSRFIATITKENLDRAFFVHDILPENANWDSHPIKDLHVTLLKGIFKPTESSKGLMLNEAQRKLLRSANYSDNLKFFAHCKGKHEEMGDVEDYDLAYFVTVLPEQEAVYREGTEAFISYLRENSREVISEVKSENLKPGQIQFTILTNGRISNVDLISTSGYSSVDETMLNLIENAPGSWEPASNSSLLKVEQQLTFFYGMMGC